MNFLSASVDIKVDDSKLSSQLAKAKTAVTKTVDKIKLAFSKMATSFKAAFDKIVRYAKYGAIAVVGALTLMARAAMKQEDAYARLTVVLKSTGYAAGLTRKQLIAHAEALQKVTVYGDETIQGMQALLLTFKSIRGEVFYRTTEAILDLSKAMGQDLQQSVIQIGKAINDPVLGMTALRRVGIQFTSTQEEMIKTLVKTGDLLGAQSIILAELESQFGGMSRIVDTTSGVLKQMWNALGDVAEVIGDALLPGIRDSGKAIKQWAEDNEVEIGYWAKVTVAYITYVKDMLIAFLKFLYTDWRAGIEYAMDVTILAFKKLGEKIYETLVGAVKRARAKIYMELQGIITLGLLEPTSVETLKKLEAAADRAAAGAAAGLPPTPGKVGITPPELQVKFDEAAEKLKAALASIEQKAGQTGKQIEEALVAPVKQAAVATEEELAKIHAVMVEEWQRRKKEEYQAMREPIIRAEKLARESAERRKRIAEDIAMSMARSWTNAIDQMMFEGRKFWDAMEDMARSLIRTIAEIIIYKKFAEPMAYGIMGLPIPGAQRGGTVTKTGLAVIHKGETFSGTGGGGGRLEVTINYTGQERHEITEAESYLISDRRIVEVTMRAMETNLRYQRSLNQVKR